MIPYSRQEIKEVDIKAVVKSLRSSIITRGNIRKQFEEYVASYVGAKYAVAYSSASTGLKASFDILRGKHKHFTTSANTFLTSAPHKNFHFQDIDLDTGNMTTDFKTDLAVVVHFAGHPVDVKKVKAKVIIEDAAHALGSEYYGQKVGCSKWSDVTVFSFHPLKAITTGEGGMCVTNDKTIYRLLQEYRDFGRRDGIKVGEGGNYHITEFQCALGLSQMKRLDKIVEKRRDIAKYYGREVKGSSWHLFPILTQHRDYFRKTLLNEGIGSQIHYRPLYQNPYFKNKKKLPNAEFWFNHEVSIPIYPKLTDKQTQSIKNLIYIHESI